jgi:hypothetical protein
MATAPRPLRVLLVEDQFLPLTRLKKLIKSSRGEVAGICRSLADFRRQWTKFEFDLAIVDLQLGKSLDNRDGWMVATEINSSDRPRPIIICSKFNGKELWRTVPRMNCVRSMGKDATLNQYLMTAYPLIHKFYPDADRMFSFHPGGNSPLQVNHQPGDKFLVKNDALGYSQMIDPALITMAKSIPGSKIRIYYEDQQIEFSQSLGGLLEIAQDERLARISDSVVVNYDYIHGKQSSNLFVKIWGDIKEVSIGKAYAENVEDWWRYFRSK